MSGYWGQVTSSVDWCESNYAVTEYIAEFWNTISSFAMVVLGLLGVYLHHAQLGWKISISYLLIVLVGIGSVLFHATLKFENQMWDELPMCWTACYLLWVLADERGYASRPIGVGLAIYCAIITIIVSGTRGSLQFRAFHVSFGLVMWSCFWFVWKVYRDTKAIQVKETLQLGAIYLISAISVWLVDLNLCFVFNTLPNPQLHAWWHILMCLSLHNFYVGCGIDSESRRGNNPQLRYLGLGIYYIGMEESKKDK